VTERSSSPFNPDVDFITKPVVAVPPPMQVSSLACPRRTKGLRMSKKRKSKKRKWPSELKGPFPMQKLEHQAMEEAGEASNAEELYKIIIRELWEAETKQRVARIAQFFNEPWPQREDEWLELIFLICAGFEAPGFQSGRPGAPKKWGGWQNARLFADVMSYATRTGHSELAAVKDIVKRPDKYLNRYSKYIKKPKTLHRQFLRAKKDFEKLDCTDVSFLRLLSPAEKIKQQIDFYSAEAEKKRRNQSAQKSTPHKDA
jgi:hypothetical protein